MIRICQHGNVAKTCPECRIQVDKVIANAQQTQHNYSLAVRAIEELIFLPSSGELSIDSVVEKCWLLPEVQTFMQNSRLELNLKEQTMRRAIGKTISFYVMEKEPNVNRKHQHQKQQSGSRVDKKPT